MNKVNGTTYRQFWVKMMLKEHPYLLSCLPTFSFLPSSFGFDSFCSLGSTSSTLQLMPEEPVYLQHTNLHLFFAPLATRSQECKSLEASTTRRPPAPPTSRAHALPKGKRHTHKTAFGATSAGCCFNRSDLLLL